VGRRADARARHDRQALCQGAAAEGPPRFGVPPRDDRDGQPHAGPESRGRGHRARGLESAVDAGRRRGLAREGLRHPHARGEGRGHQALLLAHLRRARPQASPDDGRRRRSRLGDPQGTREISRRGDRRYRGDHDGRHPAAEPRGVGEAPFSDRRRERRRHEAFFRQPLRHRPVDARRDRPGTR
jgi:hypothetical protein